MSCCRYGVQVFVSLFAYTIGENRNEFGSLSNVELYKYDCEEGGSLKQFHFHVSFPLLPEFKPVLIHLL